MKPSKPISGPFMRSFLALGVFLISIVFYFSMLFYLPSRLALTIQMGKGKPALVLIEPGIDATFIARQISGMGLTSDPAALSRWFARLGIDRSIRPGIYSIRPGSPWEIARQMANSAPEVSKITILPGETFQELQKSHGPLLVSALEDDTLFPAEIREFLPQNTEARLGYILPDTYSVSPSSKSCRELVQSASDSWWRRVGSKVNLHETKRDALLKFAILASLVEKEARLDKEREIIAGVINNRESAGMRLQIDATVVYAWSLKGVILNRVLFSHLEIDSPFNTYLYPGFPPSPICVSSIESWNAALEPLAVPYLFYVARPGGSHIFSTTYQEHIEAIRTAREEFDPGSE